MKQKFVEFESCHPDTESRVNCGFQKNRLAHFGALEARGSLDFVVENQNQILDTMIKSVTMKTANGDPSKRWYVEYREYNPLTADWTRKREYGFINKEKDPAKRLMALNELYQEVLRSINGRYKTDKAAGSSVRGYVAVYLQEKQRTLKKRSVAQLRTTLNYFITFLHQKGLADLSIHQVSKDTIQEFKRYLSGNMSNRTVNNHMDFLKSFFNYFVDNYDSVLEKNPSKGVHKLKAISENHIAYTNEQARQIFEYLRHKDPLLLLHCYFVGLGFLRCDESLNIRVRDIDFLNKTITLPAIHSKTGSRIRKPMLDLFYQILIDKKVDTYPGSYYVLSYGGQPGEKKLHYNYFRRRFKNVKRSFGLSRKHTIYSFRHTFVCQLLRQGGKWHEIMKYTGHTTMEAFSKYARALMNEPAEDLSSLLSVAI